MNSRKSGRGVTSIDGSRAIRDSWFKAATSKINLIRIRKKFEENFWRQDKLSKTSFADKKIIDNRKSANFLQIYRQSLQNTNPNTKIPDEL